MDVTRQKPFACKENDCDMTFTNEDLLTVHGQQHGMVLNLDTGKPFVAEQTPTPTTRLIKNCEEVGLFDDLKHVNPFEETFRRAVEQKNCNEIDGASRNDNNSATEQESLHTPQVYAVEEESTARDFSIINHGVLLNDNIELEYRQKQKTCGRDIKSKLKRLTSKTERPILPNTSKPMIISNAIGLSQPQIISFSFPANNAIVPIQTVHPMTNIKCSHQISIKEKLKTLLNSSSYNSGKRKHNQNRQKDLKHHVHDTEIDCMERRRAAASRYRNKMKSEQIELRKQNDKLNTENTQLKGIVKSMQEVLSRHYNCDVTRAEQNGVINTNTCGGPSIEIPPSKVRLVMDIPKLIIQPKAQHLLTTSMSMTAENWKLDN